MKYSPYWLTDIISHHGGLTGLDTVGFLALAWHQAAGHSHENEHTCYCVTCYLSLSR